MTSARHRNLLRAAQAVVSVATLIIAVVGMYILGASEFVAIGLGGALAYVVSPQLQRRLLPVPLPATDAELSEQATFRPIWIPLGVVSVLLLSLVAKLPVAVAILAVVIAIGAFNIGELRVRRDARARLSRVIPLDESRESDLR